MRGQIDKYKEVRTFEFPNWVIRVHIPDLTEEEKARRMKAIHDAAAEVLKEQYRMMKKGCADR